MNQPKTEPKFILSPDMMLEQRSTVSILSTTIEGLDQMRSRIITFLVDATLVFWFGVGFVYTTDLQVSLTYPDSIYVTVFNQVDMEREAKLKVTQVMEQQERDSKKKG